MILAIVIVALFFSLLVIVHELGHFIVARRNGVRVEEFGIGFPPAIYKLKKKSTTLSINLFPIGGFVRIKGEDAVEGGRPPSKDSFISKSTWAKTKILLAGVAMNLLLAYLIITILCIFGLPSIVQDFKTELFSSQSSGQAGLIVYKVNNDSPAAKANIILGDKIVSINGIALSSNQQLADITEENAAKKVQITYIPAYKSNIQSSEIILNRQNQNNSGYLGVVTNYSQDFRYTWWQAPFAAVVITSKMVIATIVGLYKIIVGLFSTHKLADNVTGPIGITVILSQVQRFGLNYILVLLASISISLAIINVLPIPALDGGRVFVIWLKKIGIKISPQVEQGSHIVGFVLLIILMILVSARDIIRLKI